MYNNIFFEKLSDKKLKETFISPASASNLRAPASAATSAVSSTKSVADMNSALKASGAPVKDVASTTGGIDGDVARFAASQGMQALGISGGVGGGAAEGAIQGSKFGVQGAVVGAVVGGVIGGMEESNKAKAANRALEAKLEAQHQSNLGNIEGEKDAKIQGALSRMSQSFASNLKSVGKEKIKL